MAFEDDEEKEKLKDDEDLANALDELDKIYSESLEIIEEALKTDEEDEFEEDEEEEFEEDEDK
jgi:hypothetical protein